MRKYRTLLRRLWRNAPPERLKIRVRWADGVTIFTSGHETDGDKTNTPVPPAPKDKPSSYNGDR